MKKMLGVLVTMMLVLGAMAADTDTRQFEVGVSPELDLKNVSGDVILRQGDADRIVVTYDKKDDDIEVYMDQRGDRVVVEVKYPERRWRKSYKGGVHFEIAFPAEGELDISTVSGSIEMEGIYGTIALKTVSGDINVIDSAGDLNLEVVSGVVTMKDIGDADINASAVSGQVKYSGGDLNGNNEFSTVSGSISVFYNADAAFTVNGSVMSGNISADNDGVRVKKAKYGPQTSVRGSVNGGGGVLDLNSVSGNIRLKRK